MADNSGRDSDLRNVSSRDVVYNARRPTKRTPEPPLPLFPLSPRRNLTFRPERLRLPQFAFFFDPPAAFRSRAFSSLREIFYLSLSATRLHPRVSFYISTPDTGNPCAGNQSDANGCGTKVTVDLSRSRRNVSAIRFSLTSKDPSETIIRSESRKFASREGALAIFARLLHLPFIPPSLARTRLPISSSLSSQAEQRASLV